ncbi:MAG: DUF2817 domain-containing protein [Pseudobdellovibrionaceae bacterium]
MFGLLAFLAACSVKTVRGESSSEVKSENLSVPKIDSAQAAPQAPTVTQQPVVTTEDKGAVEFCNRSLNAMPGKTNFEEIKKICDQVKQLPNCQSVAGDPIFHYDHLTSMSHPKKILVFANIHGDEDPSGSLAREWMIRVNALENPRNHWRVVPLLNPDGMKLHTRTNKNGIDLNRNFPTKDWDELAVKSWKEVSKSHIRRFPGHKGGSEPEVHCAISHIEEYAPDFVISIHTPLAVLDFDGPKVEFPKFEYLPWKSLGTFPGSLGRYLWNERKIPVLTVELRATLPEKTSTIENLQDVLGELSALVSK